MKLKFYEYKNCGTCRRAMQYLERRGIEFIRVPIREQPPTPAELRHVLTCCGGDVRRLFNTSGQDYRALDIKSKLGGMSADQAISLLAKNGNLVKRPFVVTPTGGVAGFKEEEWDRMLADAKA